MVRWTRAPSPLVFSFTFVAPLVWCGRLFQSSCQCASRGDCHAGPQETEHTRERIEGPTPIPDASEATGRAVIQSANDAPTSSA